MRPTALAARVIPPTDDDVCDSRRNEEVVDSLVGKRAFNRMRANFYVYNSSLGNEAQVTNLVVEGTTAAEDGDDEIADIDIAAHDDGTIVNTPSEQPHRCGHVGYGGHYGDPDAHG